ncbi:helix-turn-helix transcriptional regulator [Limosilactobacillus mucosae]|uniref:helix-turn-helix domain-containing protein n=1 Tax=Limosilactobacillus mucosae TaxID=97478 RepID=UPI00233F772F|nr:helix-turn-helix transcriptional regulator [Limosilactobacillus mucosae]MDC2844543.1 helix-turn-helix transcriptional regulator [Limosilactobacillus mucosae]MDC2850004.1 helix-turn-helix transcriptional regulator [Limosilactobacillus mucosae]
MLKNNLAVLMAERGLKIADLYNATGISKTTLMSIANNDSKGIQFETLDKLCNYLDVKPSDFFEYTPVLLSFSDIEPEKNIGGYTFNCYATKGNYSTTNYISFDFNDCKSLKMDSLNFFGQFDNGLTDDGNDGLMPAFPNGISNKTFFRFIGFDPQKYDLLLTVNCMSLSDFYGNLPIQFKRDVKNRIIQHCLTLFKTNKYNLSDSFNLHDGKNKILISLWINDSMYPFEQEQSVITIHTHSDSK